MARTKKKRDKKKKPPKPPLRQRLKKRGAEFLALGSTLVHEPKSFPKALLQFMRKSFRTVWDARGGGLYALGFVVTFVWLEFKMFVSDLAEFESFSSFFGEKIFEMMFRFVGESIENTVSAFLWPVPILQFSPPWGVAGLGLAYVVFANFLKVPIERWLFGDESSQREDTEA